MFQKLQNEAASTTFDHDSMQLEDGDADVIENSDLKWCYDWELRCWNIKIFGQLVNILKKLQRIWEKVPF